MGIICDFALLPLLLWMWATLVVSAQDHCSCTLSCTSSTVQAGVAWCGGSGSLILPHFLQWLERDLHPCHAMLGARLV